jgi:AcrR family transcriptional regulator
MSATTAVQLPRGPHGLSPEEVVGSQRERIFAAVIDAVGDKGYVHTSVADVLARARVSRRTFYQLFRDKEDCFVSAFEARASLLAQVLESVADEDRRPGARGNVHDRVDRILGTYLGVLAADPTSARALLIEVHAAGPRALHQRGRSMQRFVDLVMSVDGGQSRIFESDGAPRLAAQVLVGGVSSLVTGLVASGEIDRLTELRAPLMALFAKLQ